MRFKKKKELKKNVWKNITELKNTIVDIFKEKNGGKNVKHFYL